MILAAILSTTIAPLAIYVFGQELAHRCYLREKINTRIADVVRRATA